MALVHHIYKNTGLNGMPKHRKCPKILWNYYTDVITCMSHFLTSINLVCYNQELLKIWSWHYLWFKSWMLPTWTLFTYFGKTMQCFDFLLAITFHQIVVSTYLTLLWKGKAYVKNQINALKVSNFAYVSIFCTLFVPKL